MTRATVFVLSARIDSTDKWALNHISSQTDH